MNFQQLRSIRETTRCRFNLTEVANVLITSQPGVSRQIRELEEELGVDIFERNGKRLIGLTNPGKGILPIIERLLLEADNLRQASQEYSEEKSGTLTIATTHTQARYVLPQVVQAFRRAFPLVRVALQQSTPEHIAEWVMSGKADVGIATEGLSKFDGLISFPCYQWNHVIVVPVGHPLLEHETVGLAELAAHATVPVINGLTDRSHPCQLMADVLTFEEHRGPIAGQVVAWVGCGNNVARSWIEAAARFDFTLRLACPAELAPPDAVLDWARAQGARVEVTSDAAAAVRGARAVVADTWVSMSDDPAESRHTLLAPYQVTERLMGLAAEDAIFMHCLPAHRGEEVAAEVIDGPRSVVFDEAENRLHAQKGVLAWALGAAR